MNNYEKLQTKAEEFLQAGWSVLPAKKSEKRPVVSWKQYQSHRPTQTELDAWFANYQDGICLVTGSVSNNREILDFDNHGELFEAWKAKIPVELYARLVVESTPSGGRHVIYGCECEVSGNLKLAQRKTENSIITLIETRGEGGLFLCAPTEGYKLVQGSLSAVPVLTSEQRDTLVMAAWELNEHTSDVTSPETKASVQGDLGRPGDDYNNCGDIKSLLHFHGWQYLYTKGENDVWRRPGKTSGSGSATYSADKNVFYVFSSNAAPFESCKGYSPFGVYTLLEHGGDYSAAGSALRLQGYGSSFPQFKSIDTVDDSGSVMADISDPGNIPDELFDVPGFVSDVMDFTLKNAPYPNKALAFCGALALQAHLCGRKVSTEDDLRSNLYLLALASSGTGKDFPRKVNTNILHQIGKLEELGDKFASGEGIQDALYRNNAMLFQNDEMDGVLRQISSERDFVRESIPTILLTLYTASNDIYPLRVKAGQQESKYIQQPSMTLFGTATPQYFYESLSQRMLTNGLFARMIIVDVGTRGQGQISASASNIPEHILDVAKYWSLFIPEQSRDNVGNQYPLPKVVRYTDDARAAIKAFQCEADNNWHDADKRNDEIARTAWSRCCENAKKLALIYACSENHQNPVVTDKAIEWASAFTRHQTLRQLYLANIYVAENPFHKQCLRVTSELKVANENMMPRSELLRKLRCRAGELDQIIETLVQSNQIQIVSISRQTKSATGYQLLGQVQMAG